MRPDKTPGEYERRCPICKSRWLVVVEVAEYISERIGQPTLRLRWVPADTEQVAPRG